MPKIISLEPLEDSSPFWAEDLNIVRVKPSGVTTSKFSTGRSQLVATCTVILPCLAS